LIFQLLGLDVHAGQLKVNRFQFASLHGFMANSGTQDTRVKLVFQLMHTYSYWDLCACSLLHTIMSMHIHMYTYMSVYQVHKSHYSEYALGL